MAYSAFPDLNTLRKSNSLPLIEEMELGNWGSQDTCSLYSKVPESGELPREGVLKICKELPTPSLQLIADKCMSVRGLVKISWKGVGGTISIAYTRLRIVQIPSTVEKPCNMKSIRKKVLTKVLPQRDQTSSILKTGLASLTKLKNKTCKTQTVSK